MDNITIGVIIIFLILFSVWMCMSEDDTDPLEGFWKIDDDFKQESQMNEMLLYLSAIKDKDKKNSKNTHTGYIFLMIDNKPVIDETMDFIIKPKFLSSIGVSRSKSYYSMTLPTDAPTLPRTLGVELFSVKGIMTLTSKKKMYAKLVKDNKLSNSVSLNINNKDYYFQDSEDVSDIEDELEDNDDSPTELKTDESELVDDSNKNN